MRKLLYLWINGPLSVRLSQNQIDKISEILEYYFKDSVPKEFSRKPRSLKYLSYFKATELRQLLLYIGPVVFQKILNKNVYTNFLTLHVAVSILNNPLLCKSPEWINYAEKLMEKFVKDFKIIYGPQYMSHNIHNCLHISNDVRTYNCVENFSAFRFENTIFKIKKLLHNKGYKVLEQVHSHILEAESIDLDIINSANNSDNLITKKQHFSGPLGDRKFIGVNEIKQFKAIEFSDFYIDCNASKDNKVLINKKAVEIVNIVSRTSDNELFIVGREMTYVKDLYTLPCSSSTLNIKVVEKSNGAFQIWPFKMISAKLFTLPFKEKIAVFPILHSVKKHN